MQMLKQLFISEVALTIATVTQRLMADMPPEYMDDMNYGFFADSVARNTNMHPAVCLALYADIEPFTNKQQHISIQDMSERLKTRAGTLTGEAREELVYRHGLGGDPTSSETQINAKQIAEKLPTSLSYLKGNAEYVVHARHFLA